MNNFKFYRTRLGLSQREVGEALGITGQAYGNYETGKREADYDTLRGLSRLFGVSIDELLSEAGPAAEGDELSQVLEQYRQKPGMRLLFSLTRDASPDDIIQAAEIIQAHKERAAQPPAPQNGPHGEGD